LYGPKKLLTEEYTFGGERLKKVRFRTKQKTYFGWLREILKTEARADFLDILEASNRLYQ
jgi:hypothetical protein